MEQVIEKNTNVKDTIVMGIVESRLEAESILSELHQSGFSPNSISVLTPHNKELQGIALENTTKAPEGAIAGASTGGALGGVFGLLVGVGVLAIPGLGPLFAAGPLFAGLSGLVAGAAAGGLTGGLIGLGIPEIEARAYEGKVRKGNMLLAVHTRSHDAEKRAKNIFLKSKAHDVSTTVATKL
jgi:hypothetical protein